MEFLTPPQLERSVRDNIRSILNDLNIQPMWHPMREGFCSIIIKRTQNIRQRIDALHTEENANTNDLGPEYLAVIWEIATIATEGGLEYLVMMTERIVLPSLRKLCKESELFRRSEMEDEVTALSTPLPDSTKFRCCILPGDLRLPCPPPAAV